MKILGAGVLSKSFVCRHPAVFWAGMSGMAALIYQVVLQKVFSYVLGGSLLSTTIVVGSFMGGLALGGFLAGLVADRLRSKTDLTLYILIESGIGFLGIGSLLAYVAYLSVLENVVSDPAVTGLLASVPFRAAVSFVALLPMTTLIGATLPMLVRGVRADPARRSREDRTPGRVTIPELYSANLFGAMVGVLAAGYLILPYLGLWGAAGFAALLNLFVALSGIRFKSRTPVQPLADAEKSERGGARAAEPLPFGLACLLSFLSGLAIFILEIIWTHLLGAVIGTSVYAFANMLVSVLLALFLAARREERLSSAPLSSLPTLVLIGALFLAISVPFFALAPFLFSFLGLFGPGFLFRELARLAVACLLIVPVGFFLSRIFPRLLAEGVSQQKESRDVGFLLSINTIGCLAGLLAGNFFFIPVVGSEMSLKGLALLLAIVAVVASGKGRSNGLFGAGFERKKKVALVVTALVALAIPAWQPSLLLSNRSAYFSWNAEGEYNPLLYLAEDAETGFVSVARTKDGTLEMRTNGKFEGNDSNQVLAQLSFGYLPALAAPKTDKAFLVGCGTGETLMALGEFPFKKIHVAELSAPVIHAARTYFGEVNQGILDDPRVTVIHDDGRNALALSNDLYDVISIEITSVWFAGAANLYSDDFYAVVRRKLAPGGVFQQWLQLHHIRLPDLWVLLNTVAKNFKHVAVWYTGDQGQILASAEPLSLDWSRLRRLVAAHIGAKVISPEVIYRIGFQLLLDEKGVEAFLAKGKKPSLVAVSSDLFPYLEYATPKGNALEKQEYLNWAYLSIHSSKPTLIPLRNLPEDDRPLAQALLAQRCGQCGLLAHLLESRPGQFPEEEFAFLKNCSAEMDLSFPGD